MAGLGTREPGDEGLGGGRGAQAPPRERARGKGRGLGPAPPARPGVAAGALSIVRGRGGGGGGRRGRQCASPPAAPPPAPREPEARHRPCLPRLDGPPSVSTFRVAAQRLLLLLLRFLRRHL